MSTDPTSAPTVYDTNNLNQSQFQQMAQLLAKQIGSNNSGYSIIGDNAQSLLQAAMAINGTQITPAVSTPSNSTAGAPVQSMGTWDSIASNANSLLNKIVPPLATGANNSPTAPAGIPSFSAAMGNWGLVVFGAILAIGALIISQKNTVIKVASTAAKVAAE